MNPADLLLCILGFVVLLLPIYVVDAAEIARGGLPGAPVLLRLPPGYHPPLVSFIRRPMSPRLKPGYLLYDPAINGTPLHLAPVDWSKPAPPSDPVTDLKQALARAFPGSMGRPYPTPPLSREALTIQELVLAAGGRMDLDELLLELEDSFDIRLTPKAAVEVARTVPDLDVLTREGDAEVQVFVIPQKSLSASERRGLEKRVHAGLVDLRRESAPETWDSFVDSLPLAKKGKPVVIDLPAPPTDEVDRAGARALLRELHAWEKRATRTPAQLRALHEFGAMVERDAFPLRIVSTGVEPVHEEDRAALEAAIGDLSKVPVERKHPGGFILGAFQENTPATRVAEPGKERPWFPPCKVSEEQIHSLALKVAHTTICSYAEARAHVEALLAERAS